MATTRPIVTRKKPFTVIVEGNIGSGKTTFLEHFDQFDNVTLITEPVEKWRNLDGWNLLDLMYKCPEKWSMPFQSYVSLTMLQMHTKETDTKFKLMERSIYSARYCFVENLIQSKTMHPAMSTVLDKWFDFMTKTIDVSVDLIVYLKTTPSVVHDRIKKRARSEEQCVPLEYLENLHKLHEDWLIHAKNFKCPAPVLVLNADLDLTSMNNEYKRLEHKMLQMAVDAVMNSPKKFSPKRPSTSQPSSAKPSKFKTNLRNAL